MVMFNERPKIDLQLLMGIEAVLLHIADGVPLDTLLQGADYLQAVLQPPLLNGLTAHATESPVRLVHQSLHSYHLENPKD